MGYFFLNKFFTEVLYKREEAVTSGWWVWLGGGVTWGWGGGHSIHQPPSEQTLLRTVRKTSALDEGIEKKLIECDTDYKLGRPYKAKGGRNDGHK